MGWLGKLPPHNCPAVNQRMCRFINAIYYSLARLRPVHWVAPWLPLSLCSQWEICTQMAISRRLHSLSGAGECRDNHRTWMHFCPVSLWCVEGDAQSDIRSPAFTSRHWIIYMQNTSDLLALFQISIISENNDRVPSFNKNHQLELLGIAQTPINLSLAQENWRSKQKALLKCNQVSASIILMLTHNIFI